LYEDYNPKYQVNVIDICCGLGSLCQPWYDHGHNVTLVELNDKFGEKRADGFYVEHDLTQEELAQLVGASRETVNKALADFVQREWIKLEPRAVLLLDVDRLQKRAR
jgi:DNA-binding XRE family transcriptional regulator